MDLPENSVVAPCGGRRDSFEEYALCRIRYPVDCGGVDWKMDSFSEQRLVHLVVAAVATGTDRLVDRLAGRGIAGRDGIHD